MATQRLTFKAQLVQVSVPATSANLGSGFDTFALALDIQRAQGNSTRFLSHELKTPQHGFNH